MMPTHRSPFPISGTATQAIRNSAVLWILRNIIWANNTPKVTVAIRKRKPAQASAIS